MKGSAWEAISFAAVAITLIVCVTKCVMYETTEKTHRLRDQVERLETELESLQQAREQAEAGQ